MLSRCLMLVVCTAVTLFGALQAEAFSISSHNRPVRGGSTISTSFGARTNTVSSTALYAEAKKAKAKKKKLAGTKKAKKKKKKKKAKQASDEVISRAASTPPKAHDEPPRASTPPPPAPAKIAEEVPQKREKKLLYNKDGVYLGPQVKDPEIMNFDLTGGRPQVVIETEEQMARKAEIFKEIEDGQRSYPKWFNDYGILEEEIFAEYDTDDPDAIDASTLGSYDFSDFKAKFDYEFDPETDEDPNIITDTTGYIQETEKDEEGIEVGYDPFFGPSNPIDTRTKTGAAESYMINKETRDVSLLTPEFHPGDPEIEYNEDVIKIRKSLDVIETCVDDFLPSNLVVPRHVAKWHGYGEQMSFPAKNYTNNRFTKEGELTNFDELTPFRARQLAVEYARAKNAEWMPDGVSHEFHEKERQPYEAVGTLVGTLRKGECDADIVELIQPALNILGSCAELLSIEEGTVFRFHYHGLMKNKHGMACWTETLIRDCGVEITGVVFETGFRRRDPAYDGGDAYYGFT